MTSIRFDQSCNLIGQSEARSCRNAVLLPSWALQNFQNERNKKRRSFERHTYLFYQIIQPEDIVCIMKFDEIETSKVFNKNMPSKLDYSSCSQHYVLILGCGETRIL
jgi:hypothetical protein